MLPDPPAAYAGEGIEIRYTSILAEAQKAVGVGSLERFMQLIGSMAATFPNVLHILNEEEYVREYADQLNVPATAMRSRREVQQRLGAQQAQEEEARQAALMESLSKSGSSLASASPQSSPESALETLGGL